MAIKTITIDREAYETLKRHKGKGQSFSQVIKEHFGWPRRRADLNAALKRVAIGPDTLEQFERRIAARRADLA